jgi:hypothetical protein
MRPVVSVERKIRFGKAVLNYLFDLLALRKEPARYSRDLATMPFEQLLEGSFVTGGGGGNQHVVCRFCE